MGHSSHKLPKGVYIRRRIAVLLGLLAIVAIVVALIAGPERVMAWFGNSNDPAPEADASDGGSASEPSEPETPAEPGPCDTSRLGVAAVTDKTSYGAGESPNFSLRITNHNEVECDADLGTATMAFVVTSGSEVYWDSRHCQLDGEEFLVRMKPGQSLETEPIEWKRERSATDTCGDETRPTVPGGGASYHLSVEVAGVESASTQQFLLY